jgi:hypothetical protein
MAGVVWGWRVQAVEVTGATLIPNAAIRDDVLVMLQGHRWGIFPRSSVPFVGVHDLGRTLRDRFTLASVDVRRQRHGVLGVTVVEHRISAIVQPEGQPQSLMAMTGNIVGPASERTLTALGIAGGRPTSVLPVIRTVAPVATGERVLPETTVSFIRALWGELAGINIPPLAPQVVVLRKDSASFVIQTVGGANVVVTTDEDAEVQLAKLRSILRGLPEPQHATVRSIDLRYGDRVYVQ